MKPASSPVSAPRRDPKRMKAGKTVFTSVIAGHDTALLGLEDLQDSIYYLDGEMFLPTGGARASRALRKEAKKRGVL